MRGGLLLLIFGVFIVARTITKDATGRTLVDRLHPGAGWHDGGVAHNSIELFPLQSPKEQKREIAAQGYVTDNMTPGGTVKHLNPPPGQSNARPGHRGIVAGLLDPGNAQRIHDAFGLPDLNVLP